MFITIIAFIFVIGILILVHELGHFMAAKWAGVKVEEFSIGFPPRILTWKKDETQYTIGLLPLGGYVKMLGEDDSSKDPRAYNNQSVGKRFLIGIAGVVMNLLLAWVLLTVGFMAGMTPSTIPSAEVPGELIKSQIFIAEVYEDSAAAKAGLQVGDEIVGIEGDNFSSLDEVTEFTAANAGKDIPLVIKRSNEISTKTVSLSTGETPLGVGILDQGIVRVTWYKSPYVALREVAGIIKYSFVFLGDFFGQLFTTATLSNNVGGPVAIYSLSGVAARAGFAVLVQFIAMLSLNLALLNILPFPALDGGRVLFIILEKIFGKRVVKEEVEGIIHTIGFVLLLILIVAITYKDIVRLIK